MGRIVAIDYGRKRVGIAVTDPLKIIANALTTVQTQNIFHFLKDYHQKEIIDTFVVGYPKQMNNQGSSALIYINPFIKKLIKEFPGISVELSDERFTSKIAKRSIIDAGVKKEKRKDKSLIDSVSATIILQSYLEFLRIKKQSD